MERNKNIKFKRVTMMTICHNFQLIIGLHKQLYTTIDGWLWLDDNGTMSITSEKVSFSHTLLSARPHHCCLPMCMFKCECQSIEEKNFISIRNGNIMRPNCAREMRLFQRQSCGCRAAVCYCSALLWRHTQENLYFLMISLLLFFLHSFLFLRFF